jgi:hypothetical protein
LEYFDQYYYYYYTNTAHSDCSSLSREEKKQKRNLGLDWCSEGEKAPSLRGRKAHAMQHRFQLWLLLLALSASSALLGVLAADLNKGELSCFGFPFLASEFAAPAEILLNVA